MAAQFTPEQVAQLEQLFTTRVAEQVEAQRAATAAEVRAQVQTQVEQLQQLANTQHAAGAGLERQLAEAQALIADLRHELEGLRVMQLHQRAVSEGCPADAVEEAMDGSTPKQQLIDLILSV